MVSGQSLYIYFLDVNQACSLLPYLVFGGIQCANVASGTARTLGKCDLPVTLHDLALLHSLSQTP